MFLMVRVILQNTNMMKMRVPLRVWFVPRSMELVTDINTLYVYMQEMKKGMRRILWRLDMSVITLFG